AGQGSDELFGGYKRYLREYGKSSESVENSLYRDTILSYQVNFERDNKVCAFHGMELRLPFVDSDLISFSLGLPLRFKIESSDDTLRKRILRKVAEKTGLPSYVYNRPKEAIQYSTGVDKALKKLAEKRELNVREFIESSFMLMQKKYFRS
ncbi:MAG: asparagine synthase-related protein, partial [Candidatus Bathyarchaeia archaeon]